MIENKDRSGYIGASDSGYVMRSWNTATFAKWWRVKQGFDRSDFQSDAMKAGTAYEHKILDALHIPGLEKDKQIIKGRLRVNLDGNTEDKVYEVKTHNAGKTFKVTADYMRQVQVEMYALGVQQAEIVAYGLEPDDYKNFYREIDSGRITRHQINYDPNFIARYEKRMLYLCECLETGRFPEEGAICYV